jgi:hypothetical protein
MSHLPSCTTRRELIGNIWVEYSEPDQNCHDASHNDYATEATK